MSLDPLQLEREEHEAGKSLGPSDVSRSVAVLFILSNHQCTAYHQDHHAR
jgi:hypothetical protein